jgi:hypothetical protein
MKFSDTHVKAHTFAARGYTQDCVVIDMSKAGTSNKVAIVILPNGNFDTYMADANGDLTITGMDKVMSSDQIAQIAAVRASCPDRFSTIADATGGRLIV